MALSAKHPEPRHYTPHAISTETMHQPSSFSTAVRILPARSPEVETPNRKPKQAADTQLHPGNQRKFKVPTGCGSGMGEDW